MGLIKELLYWEQALSVLTLSSRIVWSLFHAALRRWLSDQAESSTHYPYPSGTVSPGIGCIDHSILSQVEKQLIQEVMAP